MRKKAIWKVDFEMQGMKQTTEVETEVIYDRPNRLFIKSQHFVFVSDGSNAFFRLPMARRYYKSPVKESLTALLEESKSGLMHGIMPDIKALISKDPAAVLRATAEDAHIEVLPDEEIGDRNCHVLTFSKRMDAGPFEKILFRVWIDKEYGLIRRVESFPPALADKKPDDDEESF